MCGDGGGDGGGDDGRSLDFCRPVVQNGFIALGAGSGLILGGPAGSIIGAAALGVAGYFAAEYGCDPPSSRADSDAGECPY